MHEFIIQELKLYYPLMTIHISIYITVFTLKYQYLSLNWAVFLFWDLFFNKV